MIQLSLRRDSWSTRFFNHQETIVDLQSDSTFLNLQISEFCYDFWFNNEFCQKGTGILWLITNRFRLFISLVIQQNLTGKRAFSLYISDRSRNLSLICSLNFSCIGYMSLWLIHNTTRANNLVAKDLQVFLMQATCVYPRLSSPWQEVIFWKEKRFHQLHNLAVLLADLTKVEMSPYNHELSVVSIVIINWHQHHCCLCYTTCYSFEHTVSNFVERLFIVTRRFTSNFI